MMYNRYYWSSPGYSMGFGFNLLSFILTVLFWWIVIMLFIKLVKWISHNHHGDCAECHRHNHDHKLMADNEEYEDEDNDNISIVKERYAKGEINKKEYEQLMKDLS